MNWLKYSIQCTGKVAKIQHFELYICVAVEGQTTLELAWTNLLTKVITSQNTQ